MRYSWVSLPPTFIDYQMAAEYYQHNRLWADDEKTYLAIFDMVDRGMERAARELSQILFSDTAGKPTFGLATLLSDEDYEAISAPYEDD